MRKLTKAQIAALAKIEDNPGRVEAVTRVAQGWLRINGNTEHALRTLGLIAMSEQGARVTYTAYGSQHTHEVKAWKLTREGADALHAATHKVT